MKKGYFWEVAVALFPDEGVRKRFLRFKVIFGGITNLLDSQVSFFYFPHGHLF